MKKLLSLFVLATLGLTACSSIGYDDAKKVETVNMKFGSTDLQSMADAMVQSLLSSPNLQYIDHSGKGDDKRVVLLTATSTTARASTSTPRASPTRSAPRSASPAASASPPATRARTSSAPRSASRWSRAASTRT
jgi:hypothetical protein